MSCARPGGLQNAVPALKRLSFIAGAFAKPLTPLFDDYDDCSTPALKAELLLQLHLLLFLLEA